MKAYELIDRLASLDEAATVEEPVVEPETIPGQEPALPSRRPSRDPFSVPPDFEPGQMPRPKAQDESGQISAWLSATQQPIQDWEWDGRELRMLMDDGSTEVYNRVQLEQSGVFDDSAAFAEALEDLGMGGEGEGDGESLYPGMEGPDQETVQAAIADEQPSNEAAGVLDQILGRTSSCGCAGGEPEMGGEMVPIEGEQADNLVQAVSDVVSAIIGLVGGEGGEPAGEGEAMVDAGEDEPKEAGSKKSEKKKDKKDGGKKKEKDDEKGEDDEKDDEKDDDKE